MSRNNYTQPVVSPEIDAGMDKHFSQYILQDLIEDYDYNSASTHDDMRQVVDALQLTPTDPDQVMIVGINGPTCAGKTSFTQAVVESLSSRDIPVVQVAFDWFLYGRDRRNTLVEDISSERKSIQEVTQTAWDTERYVSLLRSLKNPALVPNQQQIKITGVYDRTLGTQTGEADVDLPLGGYAIVEGVGILDVEDTDLIDCHIRLDVNDDEILINRAITREKNKPDNKQLSEEFLRHRFKVMDLYHMRYLRKISYGHNRHIIDASDFNNIRLFSRSV